MRASTLTRTHAPTHPRVHVFAHQVPGSNGPRTHQVAEDTPGLVRLRFSLPGESRLSALNLCGCEHVGVHAYSVDGRVCCQRAAWGGSRSKSKART